MTEVAARELRDQYRFLSTVDEHVGLTGLEIEYDKLESTVHRKATKTFGTLNINKSKNRYANIDMLPCTSRGKWGMAVSHDRSRQCHLTHGNGSVT